MEAKLLAPTLRGYRSSWLAADVVAGLTLLAIVVPEQIATARLINLPPVAGLYAFVVGSLTFALLGRNRHVSVGADSTIAPVMGAGVAAIAAVGTVRYDHLVSLLAVMVAVLVVAVGLLRLGWIAEFLSTPVVTGVLGGIGIEIVVRQLPAILGLPGGGGTVVGRLRKVADQVGHTNGWAVAIAAVVFLAIVVGERVSRRIPGAMIGFVASIIAVAVFSVKAHGVATLGAIHGGLPTLATPSGSWSDLRNLIGPALVTTFLCVAQTAATERASDQASPSSQDFNRDLVAIGAGSVVSAMVGSFAVNSSPPRTLVVAESGGRTQLAGIVAAAVAFALVLGAAGWLRDLPQATLGAILVYVATRLLRAGELRRILSFDRVEFSLAMVALVAVAIVGIEQGIVAALVLGLAEQTYRSARPRGVVMGRQPGTDHWIPTDVGLVTEQVPGIVVYLIAGPLWYANADFVVGSILALIGAERSPAYALVLDANGVSEIDYTAAKALARLAADLKQKGVATGIARTSHLVHHDLKHSGLLADLGHDHLFPTVEEAVHALTDPA